VQQLLPQHRRAAAPAPAGGEPPACLAQPCLPLPCHCTVLPCPAFATSPAAAASASQPACRPHRLKLSTPARPLCVATHAPALISPSTRLPQGLPPLPHLTIPSPRLTRAPPPPPRPLRCSATRATLMSGATASHRNSCLLGTRRCIAPCRYAAAGALPCFLGASAVCTAQWPAGLWSASCVTQCSASHCWLPFHLACSLPAQVLLHASECTDPKCPSTSCARVKAMYHHAMNCPVKLAGNCQYCRYCGCGQLGCWAGPGTLQGQRACSSCKLLQPHAPNCLHPSLLVTAGHPLPFCSPQPPH